MDQGDYIIKDFSVALVADIVKHRWQHHKVRIAHRMIHVTYRAWQDLHKNKNMLRTNLIFKFLNMTECILVVGGEIMEDDAQLSRKLSTTRKVLGMRIHDFYGTGRWKVSEHRYGTMSIDRFEHACKAAGFSAQIWMPKKMYNFETFSE
jgi:hypothetical protein